MRNEMDSRYQMVQTLAVVITDLESEGEVQQT